MTSPPAVVLITGASSGIGKACAEHLSAMGHRVVGTSRRQEGTVGAYELIRMDVTQDRAVSEAVDRILQREGRLDVVVNNAGLAIAGAVEDTSIEEAKLQFDTNFFGAVRVCRAALPAMRRQGAGVIINISSIAGMIALPFQGFYSASKFAIEGFSEALRMEVAPFGIRVVLVQPGDFRTSFTENRIRALASKTNPAYQEQLEKTLGIMERDEREAPSPERVAKTVGELIRKRAPRLRNTVGMFTQRFAVVLKRVLPGKWFEGIIRGTYKL